MSRNKGKTGERELAAMLHDLTGWNVKRRVRQHDGDSDLEGVHGWCIEVKRYARAGRADIRGWWQQAARQAAATGLRPVLFYRQDRDEWRAVWPVAIRLLIPQADAWQGYEWTVDGSIGAWCAVARETMEA